MFVVPHGERFGRSIRGGVGIEHDRDAKRDRLDGGRGEATESEDHVAVESPHRARCSRERIVERRIVSKLSSVTSAPGVAAYDFERDGLGHQRRGRCLGAVRHLIVVGVDGVVGARALIAAVGDGVVISIHAIVRTGADVGGLAGAIVVDIVAATLASVRTWLVVPGRLVVAVAARALLPRAGATREQRARDQDGPHVGNIDRFPGATSRKARRAA